MGEMTVVFKYPETPGRYPFHCQVLEHQDYAMLAEYEVV
jgi:FtsP/CotA-like multicopper oxidase with cupredoxin domain